MTQNEMCTENQKSLQDNKMESPRLCSCGSNLKYKREDIRKLENVHRTKYLGRISVNRAIVGALVTMVLSIAIIFIATLVTMLINVTVITIGTLVTVVINVTVVTIGTLVTVVINIAIVTVGKLVTMVVG